MEYSMSQNTTELEPEEALEAIVDRFDEIENLTEGFNDVEGPEDRDELMLLIAVEEALNRLSALDNERPLWSDEERLRSALRLYVTQRGDQ